MMPATQKSMPDTDSSDEKFSLLKELTGVILMTDNISAIANLILDIVVNRTRTRKCSLMLINDREELYILAARGMDIHIVRDYVAKPGEGIVGNVAKLRRPVLVKDIDSDERFSRFRGDRYSTKSFISCPITCKNRLLGVLNASARKDGNPFTEDEFDLMQLIAHQAAIAFENAFMVTRLRLKAVELEEMNRKLMDSDLVKTEFLTRVSHELRTPLNSIKGAAYYLNNSAKLTMSEQKEFYSIISSETGSLSSIVENQLNFLKFEDETRDMKIVVVNLTDILKEVSESKSISTLLARKKLTLDARADKEISDIACDKIKTAQMFFNLLEGMISYIDRGGALQITTAENELIHVKIAAATTLPDDVIAIFSRLGYPFQEDGREEKVKIYLAKKVAENHGWSLAANNTDSGFCIQLTIPKCKRQKINAAVGKSIDLFLEFIAELLRLDICSIMLSDNVTGNLRIQSALGLTDEIIRQTCIRPGEKICGWVAVEGKPLLIENIENDPRLGKRNIQQYNTKSLLSLPLKIGNMVVGVLNLNNKKSADSFTAQDLQLATVLSERISSVIEKLQADEHWENGFQEMITSFDNLLNAGRKYHKKTSILRNLVSEIMEILDTTEEQKLLALYVSSVYDLGLMLMDDAIFSKKKLEPSEIASLQIHPYTTVELLNCFETSPDVKKAILYHHERYDGKGYPDGLAGNEIPLISRVIAVVDGYCSMLSKRPHRQELKEADALAEIRKGSGSCYDPSVVRALEEALKR